MKYKYEFKAEESFNKGCCRECPSSVDDFDSDCDVYCVLYARYDECPLEKIEN